MTAPFTDALNAALRQATQGGIVDLYGGLRVFPQFHCCLSGNTAGVYKDPVAILEVSNQELCEATPLSVSFSKSFSATSTLTLWSVDWGDGNVSNGGWPPPASVPHPAGGYAFAGVYTIILTITDILGAYDRDAQQVNVLYCPMFWVPPPGIVVGATGFGACYTNSLVPGATTWADMQSAGLSLPGSKNVHCLKFVRNHINGLWHVFAGTDCGVWRYDYMPAGTGAWSYVLTTGQMASLGGYPLATSSVWEIDNSLDAPGRVYAIFGGLNWPWSGCAVAVSSDYFTTVDRIVYIWQGNFPIVGDRESSIRCVQGSGGGTAYAGVQDISIGPHAWKTTNSGAGWNQVFINATGADEIPVHTPYLSESGKGLRVYAMANNNTAKYTSADGGASFVSMGNQATRPMKIQSSPYRSDIAEYITRYNFYRWSGAGYTNLYNLGTAWGRDYLATMRDNAGNLQEAALVGDAIATAFIHLWDPTQLGGAMPPNGNCFGNWTAVTGGANARAIADYNYGWPRG